MAISVTALGTGQSKSATIGISLSGPVLAGDQLFLVLAGDSVPTQVQYTYDSGQVPEAFVEQIRASNAGNVFTVIYRIVNPTPSGGNPTVSCNGTDSRAIAVFKVSGLSTDAFDASAVDTGSGASPSSGATGTLAQADEICIGAIGTEGPDGDTAGTWSNGFTAGQRIGTASGGAASNITISEGYKIVSATTAETAAKTGITSRDWAAAIATFKAPSGEGVGSSSGLSTVSGVGASKFAGSGTSAGVATASAASRTLKRTVGSSAGSSTAVAVGTEGSNVITATGTSAGISTVSGEGAARFQAAGTSTGVSTGSGVGRARIQADAVSSGSSTALAVSISTSPATGTSAGTSTALGTGAAKFKAQGTSAGLTTVLGVGSSIFRASASSAGISTVLSTGKSTFRSTGISIGTSTVLAVSTYEGGEEPAWITRASVGVRGIVYAGRPSVGILWGVWL